MTKQDQPISGVSGSPAPAKASQDKTKAAGEHQLTDEKTIQGGQNPSHLNPAVQNQAGLAGRPVTAKADLNPKNRGGI